MEAQLDGYHKLVKEQFDAYRHHFTELIRESVGLKVTVDQVTAEVQVQNQKIDRTYMDASTKIGEIDGASKANQATMAQAMSIMQNLGAEVQSMARRSEERGTGTGTGPPEFINVMG